MTPITFFKANSLNKTIQFPTEWDELLFEDLLFIAGAIWDKSTTPQSILMKLLDHRVKGEFDLEMIDFEQLAIDGLPLVDFIVKNIGLTKFPFNENHKYIRQYADGFNDMVVKIYEETETNYLLFAKTKELEYLDKFCEVLNGNITKLSQNEKYLLHLWYTGCRSNLPKMFVHLYSKTDDDDSIKEITGLEFTSIIHLGAGERNGLRSQIREYLLLEFLYDMDLEAKRNIETRNQLKQD